MPMEGERAMANIGKSISIKGDLTGSEDVVVEGKVEGKIELPQNELTIGADGNVHADVHAKTVMVIGRVAGNVSASERVEPKLVVQEGAVVNGSIQMEGKAGEPKPATQAKPATPSPSVPERRPAPPPA
jgi:cytoskeletal protein CcmA (bactofilin family)